VVHVGRVRDHGLVRRLDQSPSALGDGGTVQRQSSDAGIRIAENAVDGGLAIGVFVILRIHRSAPRQVEELHHAEEAESSP
jgi:hypothetical protein